MNKDQHDIDKLFQDAFGNNYEAAPPSNMWDKIESSLPLTETDQLFKNALENYERQPSPEVWGRIQPELPLSLTVRNVFVQLSKIAAILLVGITVYMFAQQFEWSDKENFAQQKVTIENPNNHNDQSLTEQEIVETSVDDLLENNQIAVIDPSEATIPISKKTQQSVINSPYNNAENTAKGGNAIYANYPTEATINVNEIARRLKNGDKSRIPSKELFDLKYWETEEKESKSKVDTLTKEQEKELNPLNNKKMEDVYAANEPIDLDGKIRRPKTTDAIAQNNISLLYLSLQGKPDASITHAGIRFNRSNLAPQVFNFKGFYVSANAALGNSFMFNNSMKEGVMGENANYKLTTLGTNFGLGLGYQMSPKLSIETGLNYVNQNQTYTNSKNGDKINLNYYAVPVTMKYRTNEISSRKPAAISYVFGVQTAFLETANIISEPSPFVEPQAVATQTELGITAGVDYDLYLNKNLSWTIGGRVNWGTDVANPFKNNNGFIGVRSALNFRFAK
jgi:hypothetical protein